MTQTIEQQIAELRAKIAELEKQKVWPQDGDKYYLLESDGSIQELEWNSDYMDKPYKSQGSIFRTCEAAEKERNKRALIVEIREFAEWYEPDWGFPNGSPVNITFCYAYGDKQWFIKKTSWEFSGEPWGYFKDEATAKAALVKFADRLHLFL